MADIDKTLARMAILLTHGRSVSRTALNKLLFFADVAHLIKVGKPISESKYVKLDFGPVPQHIDAVRNWLQENGFVRTSVGLSGPYVQHSYSSAHIDADNLERIRTGLGGKGAAEIVTNVADALSGMSASALSEISHRYEPWKSGNWYQKLDLNEAKKDSKLKEFLKDKKILN